MLTLQTRTLENRPVYHRHARPPRQIARTGKLLAALIACIAMGCGDGRPDRVEVSGKVLIDGQPVPLGSIKFVPKGARPSAGQIDENGNFVLTCYDGNDGVVPGEHRVQVAAIKIISDSKIHWYAPKRYASFRTSGLTKEVTESTDDMVIELTWGDKKPKNGKYLVEK